MGFNPVIKQETVESASDLSFLGAKKVAPASIADGAKSERALVDGRKKTLRLLNALKIVSPIIVAVMERSSEKDSIDLFKKIVSTASDSSELVMRELGEDPSNPDNYWIRNTLERAFCEIIKEQAQRGKDVGIKLLEPLIIHLASMDMKTVSDKSTIFEPWANSTMVRTSLVKAMAPIIVRSGTFDFFRKNLDLDMEAVARDLMAAASRATIEIVDPSGGEKERASLFSVLVSEAGNIYANAWQVCGKQMVGNLSSLSDKELSAMLSDHPKGLPLDDVKSLFEKNFNRMVSLSLRLVPLKNGKLESRVSST